MRRLLLIALLLLGWAVSAEAAEIVLSADSGRFFLDTDGDGVKDAGEDYIDLPSGFPWIKVDINVGGAIPRTTNGAAATTEELATNDIMRDRYDFDASTEEAISFDIVLGNWDEGTIKAKFYWDAAATASGTVVWGIACQSYSDSDVQDTAFSAETTVTDTLLTVGDMHISDATGAITVSGTPGLDDLIRCQVVAETGGTIAVDVHLGQVVLQYGSDEDAEW